MAGQNVALVGWLVHSAMRTINLFPRDSKQTRGSGPSIVALNFGHSSPFHTEKLERQREKLLEAHYANAIPLDLLSREQDRISSALAKIAAKVEGIDDRFDTVERNLDRALELATDCAAAYREAPESVRRMFNQVFFERVLVFPDDNAPEGVRVDSELREPFDVLLGADLRLAASSGTTSRKMKKTANPKVDGLTSSGSPQVLQVKGLSKELLVEVRGFEPLTS